MNVLCCFQVTKTLLPSSGGKSKQDKLSLTHLLLQHTSLEAALRLGDVSQAGVRSALQLMKPGQVLLLGLGALLGLQRPL